MRCGAQSGAKPGVTRTAFAVGRAYNGCPTWNVLRHLKGGATAVNSCEGDAVMPCNGACTGATVASWIGVQGRHKRPWRLRARPVQQPWAGLLCLLLLLLLLLLCCCCAAVLHSH